MGVTFCGLLKHGDWPNSGLGFDRQASGPIKFILFTGWAGPTVRLLIIGAVCFCRGPGENDYREVANIGSGPYSAYWAAGPPGEVPLRPNVCPRLL